MPLPNFANEAEFRENWIRPYISKMGFVHVNLIHGSGEQGKDFFFADYDRFEHQRFYAVQAKNGNIGAGQKELDELLNQVRRCFTVKLRFHKDANERRVSAVYIMASGKISPEAREYISDWCASEKIGENVYYLDGDTLDRLEKHVTLQEDKETRYRLAGLQAEADFNSRVLPEIRKAVANRKLSLLRTMYVCLESFVSNPVPSFVPPQLLIDYWVMVRHINGITEMGWVHDNVDQLTLNGYLEQFDSGIRQTKDFHSLVTTAIANLEKRYAIQAEVIST